MVWLDDVPNFIPTQILFGKLCELLRVLFFDVRSRKAARVSQGLSWYNQRVAAELAYLSFQNPLNSSIVLVAPRILANTTSTPASPAPQNALQKSSERLANSGEFARANLARDVVDDVRLAISGRLEPGLVCPSWGTNDNR